VHRGLLRDRTGIGGVIGPQVFSRVINTESYEQVFLALGLGAVMMILGGLAELVFDVKAERESLERIAKPLTVNKQRARSGESKTSSRTSTSDISSSRRGGLRSGKPRPRGRTREQLYQEARSLGVKGRSRMNKAQLRAVVDNKKRLAPPLDQPQANRLSAQATQTPIRPAKCSYR
jgi:hypothetical protein